MNAIHISTARKMLESPEPVSLKVFTKEGKLIELEKVVGLRSARHTGQRNIKVLASGQIRKIRDVLIVEINGLPTFL